MILAWTGDELRCGQAQNGVNLDLSYIWPWRSRSTAPQNNKDLNQGLLHLWAKFGDPSLNGWWVIVRTSSWLMHRQTHTQTQATTKLGSQNWASGKNDKNENFHIITQNMCVIPLCFEQLYKGILMSQFRSAQLTPWSLMTNVEAIEIITGSGIGLVPSH